MKGFGAKRKKFVSIQSIMAEPWSGAQRWWASHMGRDRNCFFPFVKSELSTTFISGGFLQKHFVTTEWPWGSTGVKLYGWVKSYLLFKKKKKRVFRHEAKMLEAVKQSKKIYLVTSIWVITQATNDMKTLSQHESLLPAGLSQRQPAHCPVIRTHLQLKFCVCATLHTQGTEACLMIRLTRSLSSSLWPPALAPLMIPGDAEPLKGGNIPGGG